MADTQKELALRLAWYVDRYGEIPRRDIIKIWSAATLGKKDDDAQRIIDLADEILDYFRSMD